MAPNTPPPLTGNELCFYCFFSCRNAVMKNCCPDWNVPAFQQPQPLPPSAINGESADWTAPTKDEDDLHEKEWWESITRKTVRERNSGLSPLRTFLCVSMNLEWTVSIFAATNTTILWRLKPLNMGKKNDKVKCCEPHKAREKKPYFQFIGQRFKKLKKREN